MTILICLAAAATILGSAVYTTRTLVDLLPHPADTLQASGHRAMPGPSNAAA